MNGTLNFSHLRFDLYVFYNFFSSFFVNFFYYKNTWKSLQNNNFQKA